MTLFRMLASRFFGLFRKRRLEKELDEELRSHVEMQVEENLKKGMSAGEARRAALRSFGGVEQAKEAYRDQRGLPFLETLFQDLRYGVRMLAKNPGFTAVTVLTLALGIGANTAMFSVVNAVLLRPLPYPQSDRLVTLWMTIPELGYTGPGSTCDPDFREWQSQNQTFDEMAAFQGGTMNLAGHGVPERLQVAEVSASLFPLLGARPALGRAMLAADQESGRSSVVLLSHQLWQRKFGADAGIIGKSIDLDGKARTVVGVMPPAFDFPNQAQIWTPLVLTNDCSNAVDQVVARLKPGVSLVRARNDLDVISQRVAAQRHQSAGSMWLVPLQDAMVSNIRGALLILLAAVGFVLLIACANIAGLLLARATARDREIAVRKALGASRWRITRQLLTESVLLAVLGGGLGLLLALWARETLVTLLPQTVIHPGEISRTVPVTIDSWVLGFTLLVSLGAGLIFGILPALQASRSAPNQALKESGSTFSQRSAIRNIFVVAELALTLTLVVSAGLLLKSLVRLLDVNPGFDAENLLTLSLGLPDEKYQSQEQMKTFHAAILERIEALPGVRASGTVSFGLPLTGSGLRGDFTIEGQPAPPSGVVANKFVVSPGYFAALGVSLIRGRVFSEQDGDQAARVAVVSQGFARKFWPRGDALGHRIMPGFSRSPWYTIVGVVADVQQGNMQEPPPLEIYLPYDQSPAPFLMNFMSVVVRVRSAPLGMTNSVRGAVQSVDPEMPVYEVASMEQLVARSVSEPRFNALLVGCFAGAALLLACVGVYGTIAYTVAQRRHEFGIRIALGAEGFDVLMLVAKRGLKLALAGVGLGIVGALAMTRFLAGLLFAVKPTDPTTFVAVSILMIGVALLACYLPARRATRVDPMVALRYE
jgi:putative ABC transport system permease protein